MSRQRRIPLRRDAKPVAEEETFDLRQRLLSVLKSEPLINGLVALAITVGFFHGLLKIKFHSPATTFLFDGLLSLVLMLVLMRLPRGERFIPEGRVGDALKVFYVVCLIYALIPLGPPVLVTLASWRGWCFATLMFSVGYHLTRRVEQVKGYFYILLLLGLITAIYGLRQSPEEVEKQIQEDEVFAERYNQSYYVTSKGRQLRIFSTFVSSGAFGGTLAYVIVFAVALFTDEKAGRKEKLLLMVLVVPMTYALVRSGSRSALLSLGFGFTVLAWYRKNIFNFIIIPGVVVVAVKLAAEATGGSAMERYSTLLNVSAIYDRNAIPTQIGWDFMMDGHLFGGGLGRSGYSAPSFLTEKFRDQFWGYVFSDGDLGRLMIEMGVVGMALFGWIIAASCRMGLDSLRSLRNTSVATVAVASASCVVMAFASFPSGSPFLGIPMGALTWFFLGTLQKLAHEHKRGALEETAGTVSAEPAPPAKRFRYHRTDSPS